jgi:hypothetical protein
MSAWTKKMALPGETHFPDPKVLGWFVRVKEDNRVSKTQIHLAALLPHLRLNSVFNIGFSPR